MKVVTLLLGTMLIGCVGDVQTSCKVGGALAGGSSCTFTNTGTFPGKACVQVTLKKTKESASNPFIAADESPTPVGSVARSQTLCSGTVWGSSTNTVDIGYIEPNPMKMCGGWDNCEMNVVAQND